MHLRVLVLADDLTGACDAGVQFAEDGLSTLILTRPMGRFHGGCDVLVVNTETRKLDVYEAYKRVKEVSEIFKSSFEAYYKKVDSTMRGHVGAEVEAMLEGLGLRAAVMSPAYPENGRVVLGGHLFVNGEPLDKTEFMEHEGAGSYIPHIIGREVGGKVACIDLSLMRRGVDAVRDKVRELIHGGVRIIVADAASRGDLKTIVEACSGVDDGLLLCGSAGLARELANHIAGGLGGVLVVSGSLKKETLEQIGEAERKLPMRAFKLSPGEIREGKPSGLLLDSLLKELKLRGIAALTSALSRGDEIPGAGEAARKTLSRTVRRILMEVKLSHLVIIGGDTAASILSEMQVHSLKPLREVGEGIPLNVIPHGRWRGLKVVTKAGGFGSAEALLDALNRLRPWKSLNNI